MMWRGGKHAFFITDRLLVQFQLFFTQDFYFRCSYGGLYGVLTVKFTSLEYPRRIYRCLLQFVMSYAIRRRRAFDKQDWAV